MGWMCSSGGRNKEANQPLESKEDGMIICKLCFGKGHCEDVKMPEV
jgi:hypothetical protein